MTGRDLRTGAGSLPWSPFRVRRPGAHPGAAQPPTGQCAARRCARPPATVTGCKLGQISAGGRLRPRPANSAGCSPRLPSRPRFLAVSLAPLDDRATHVDYHRVYKGEGHMIDYKSMMKG